MVKHLLAFITVLFFMATNGWPVDHFPVSSEGDIEFFIDTATFMGDEDMVYQEVYYGLNSEQLVLKEIQPNLKQGLITIQANILSLAGDTLATDVFSSKIEITVDEHGNTVQQMILQQSAFGIIPGNYWLDVVLKDDYSPKTGHIKSALNIENFPRELCISDIEFALKISTIDKEQSSIFQKGNKIVLPCPSHQYNPRRNSLNFYFEVYHYALNDTPLTVTYFVENAGTGKVENSQVETSVKKPGESCALFYTIDLKELNTGTYQLVVQVQDSAIIQARHATFFYDRSGDNNLSLDDIEKQKLLLTYFGTPRDLNQFNSLNEIGKTEFLIHFWRKMDPVPATEENEFLQEIYNRIVTVNNLYSTPYKKGWETDAGRIIIKFGAPGNIQKFVNNPDAAPHEIWYYHERDREFWFLVNGAEPYRLVHSVNEPTEIDLPSWELLIKKADSIHGRDSFDDKIEEK